MCTQGLALHRLGNYFVKVIVNLKFLESYRPTRWLGAGHQLIHERCVVSEGSGGPEMRGSALCTIAREPIESLAWVVPLDGLISFTVKFLILNATKTSHSEHGVNY